jgi:hypothetical protein
MVISFYNIILFNYLFMLRIIKFISIYLLLTSEIITRDKMTSYKKFEDEQELTKEEQEYRESWDYENVLLDNLRIRKEYFKGNMFYFEDYKEMKEKIKKIVKKNEKFEEIIYSQERLKKYKELTEEEWNIKKKKKIKEKKLIRNFLHSKNLYDVN